ncbi:DUF362 domain-containing protein [Streptomyces polyrhachis]|uniref:DUF362 domain-containing protein n=1 Tax=Streptomyces polyrhachis TaxID=1282885 RepID=A0ABW2GI05_9ACTN
MARSAIPARPALEAEARSADEPGRRLRPEARSADPGARGRSPRSATRPAVHVTPRCAGCGACLLTCPTHAIRPTAGTLTIREDLCTGCLECIDVCPVDAIEELPLPPTPPSRSPR